MRYFMLWRGSLLGLLACLCCLSNVQAQPSVDFSESAPQGIVTDDTIAAGSIDLSQIDIDAMLRMAGIAAASPEGKAMAAPLKMIVQGLSGAGANESYVTVPSGALIRGGLCLVVPCDDKQAVQRLLQGWLRAVPPQFEYVVLQRKADVVACPSAVSEQFLKEAQNVEARTELDEAVAAMQRFPHRLVVDLPDELHSEIAAVWPEHLKLGEQVEISPQRMMRSIRAIAFGVSLPPDPQVELRLFCTDEDAATTIQQELSALIDLLPPSVPRLALETKDSTIVGSLSSNEVTAFLAGATASMRQSNQRMQSSNSLKQLGLAFHNYYSKYHFFPGKYTVDADGTPLLSWRVLLLPYLDAGELYKEFHRDEPWDSPHNRKRIATMPEVFKVQGDSLPAGQTRMRLPVIEGSAWDGTGPPKEFRDITDGSSNTIWVAVAPESAAVPWTKPDDWQLDADNLIQDFFGDSENTLIGRFDGSVQTLSSDIGAKTLKALLTIAGGEVINE